MHLLHTMLRVKDLEESLSFYCDILEMKLIKRKDYPEGEFTLAFVGYSQESNSTLIELTHNWKPTNYNLGNAYGHIAIGVNNIYSTCNAIKQKGWNVTREPGPMKYGNTVIAFIVDPNGYAIELIQIEN
ncbi:lactoylglutathione lyase [Candidatus Atelocyanobacterium thalassae]|uniref:lactoylglutathione lyase n=1 Tax=cyanobacterium endosymbiont of Braarudosphaera bigelowii TaxID=1285375 RepID=A0ABM7U4A3_9CHRO|nr:lactoylglutathione lyase [Candidatus Atelocyanobacterium thalassa]BDA39468.1 lactoylglutathione lyase [cyanobacterium endosymbiont of Braarudosphaera bigelowii]